MTKLDLKSKLEGNNLDLSLNELKEVPTKEIAAIAKATSIDLSCNQLSFLPEPFCDLTRITWLDLSKNALQELPSNVGNLSNLQHLDLYNNQLNMLPVSFRNLKKLKWLDLKNNPLDPQLATIAGDCLDAKQCQLCAKRIVSFMDKIYEKLEAERQLKLKKEEEKEARRLLKVEKSAEKEKQRKKDQKEQQRKAERAVKIKQKQQAANSHDQADEDHIDQLISAPQVNGHAKANTKQGKKKKVTKGSLWTKILWRLFILLLLGVVSSASVLFWYIEGDFRMERVREVIPLIQKDGLQLRNLALENMEPYWIAFKYGSIAVYEHLEKEAPVWMEKGSTWMTNCCKDALHFVDHSWHVAWSYIQQLTGRFYNTAST